MTSQFDKEGIYFAQLTEDGKLKIWNTVANSFEQEYVPDLHLSSPFTCLQFINPLLNISKNASPKKKKRRSSSSGSTPDIVVGNTTGKLIVYSISKGDVKHVINGDINLPVNCLSQNIEEELYSGVEENVVVWDIYRRIVTNKWKSGNDKISSILDIPQTKRLLTASKSIKLWNIETKTLLKTFKGHSSDVCLLQTIPNVDVFEPRYVISGSKGDRLLNCWNLSEDTKDGHATVSLLMEDSVKNISVHVSPDGSTKIATSVINGVVHIFHLVLNGKCNKPVKPKSTIGVVSDTGQKTDVRIPIISGFLKSDDNLLITYGSSIALTFEDVELGKQKLVCLVRNISHSAKNENKNKVLTPIVGNDVHYVTPYNNVASTTKRKADGNLEVSMEKRLENLSLNKLEDGKTPNGNNMAHLLLQGLRSKDRNIIKSVLCRKDEQVIKNTVEKLRPGVILQLVKELTNFIQGKTISSQIGALWLRHLIKIHTSLLISNPDLSDLLAPMLNTIENRLRLQSPLSRLRGRLNLLLTQVGSPSYSTANDEPMMEFYDKDSSDSDGEIQMAELTNSASENEWSEELSDEDQPRNEKDTESDEEMST